MSDALRSKIEAEIDETTWDALAIHASRDALFLVDPSIGLVTAAVAIATNRTAIVAHWIDTGALVRPTPETRARFDEEPEAHRFRLAIVQPFVLAELSSCRSRP